MIKTVTFSEARQNFANILNTAEENGEVFIVRKNGSMFVVRPVYRSGSLLDVEGINLNIKADEIVKIIREGRERPY